MNNVVRRWETGDELQVLTLVAPPPPCVMVDIERYNHRLIIGMTERPPLIGPPPPSKRYNYRSFVVIIQLNSTTSMSKYWC